MLVTLTEILEIAEDKECAIGSFNTPNLTSVLAVIKAAESIDVPVIISHAELHEEVAPLEDIGPVMLLMAKNAKVPVCVHLDHGESLSYIEKALEIGFTSVMYDGSLLSYEENVKNTQAAVEMARAHNASIEAELGILGGREAGSKDTKSYEDLYTDPIVAKKFVDETGIDALAASFGTAHGLYKKKPNLDFGRVEKIYDLCKVPLVMHGGSGVSPEDYRKAISKGVRKINYYSYMANAGVKAVKEFLSEEDVVFYHDIDRVAQEKMMADALTAMKVFSESTGL